MRSLGTSMAVVLVVFVPTFASALDDGTRCKVAIVKRGSDLFAKTKDIDASCEAGQLTRLNTDGACPSTRDNQRLDSTTTSSDVAIDKACVASIPRTTNCVDSAASEAYDVVGGVYAGSPVPEPDRAHRGCRRAIGREATRFADFKAKELRTCNDRAVRGVSGYGPQGPACDGPNDTQASIASARNKVDAKIAAACGGADHTIGTGDDLDPQADLGFGSNCSGAPYCESPIDTLTDLVSCVKCIADQEVDQVLRGLAALPLDAPTACRAAVGRAVENFFADMGRDISDCRDNVLDGDVTPPCPDAETAADIAHNEAEYAARIADDCGGPAGPPAAALEAAIDALVQALYPLQVEDTDNTRRRCKNQIGATLGASSGFARQKARALRICRSQVLCGQTSGACPDSEALARITKSAAKNASSIASRCAAYTPAELGFGATCPALGSCGSLPTTTVAELAACVECVSEVAVDALIAVGFSPSGAFLDDTQLLD